MRIFGSNARVSLHHKRKKKEKKIKPGVKTYKDYFPFYCIRKLDLPDTPPEGKDNGSIEDV